MMLIFVKYRLRIKVMFQLVVSMFTENYNGEFGRIQFRCQNISTMNHIVH